jgi:hypothetical protein
MVIHLLDAHLRVVNDVKITSIFQSTTDVTGASASCGNRPSGRE